MRRADIAEKETKRGLLVFVVPESEIAVPVGKLLLRARHTLIWRKPG